MSSREQNIKLIEKKLNERLDIICKDEYSVLASKARLRVDPNYQLKVLMDMVASVITVDQINKM